MQGLPLTLESTAAQPPASGISWRVTRLRSGAEIGSIAMRRASGAATFAALPVASAAAT